MALQMLINGNVISTNVNFLFISHNILQSSPNQCYNARKHICMEHRDWHTPSTLSYFLRAQRLWIVDTESRNSFQYGMRTCAHTLHPFRATRRLQLGTQAVAAAAFICVCVICINGECFIYVSRLYYSSAIWMRCMRAHTHTLEEEDGH